MSQVSWPGGRGDARPIGDIAKRLLRHKRFHEKGKFGALVDAWCQLVGDEVASRTRIGAFKDGGLVIEVDSPVLLHELNGFLKEQLLAGLQATEGGRDVAEIRLRLGGSRGRDGREHLGQTGTQ